MNRTQGRILVIRGGAIGDFILTLPALSALRRHFPETHLEVLGYPHIAQLALAGGIVDGVRSIEARQLAGFFARHGTLDSGLREYFADFAVILSYLYDPDGIFQDNVARCSRAQFIAGPHRPDEQLMLHATEVFLKPLERLAIFAADTTPRLSVAGQRSNRIALHPGSGSERKNWPAARWEELLQALTRGSQADFLLVLGEAEADRLERLAGLLPPDRLQVARSLPLPELARHLAGCAVFVGHDSGITHLAAAIGVPVVVLWGETKEAIWKPRTGNLTLLRNEQGLAGITVDQVLRVLVERVPLTLAP